MIGKSRNKRTRAYPSSVTNRELVIEPAPHVTGHMTKDLLMKYTFVSLCILAAAAVLAFGITALIMEIVAVVVAIISDDMLSRVMREKGPTNIYSAAVSGLVVALSFTSGVPVTYNAGDLAYLGISEGQPFISTIMDSNIQYLAVAIISALAVILFKKIQGLLGRKYLNPAAAAKLLVLGPLYTMSLIPSDHLNIANMSAEALTKPLPLLPSGAGLEGTLAFCYAGSNAPFPDEVLMDLLLLKNHGWIGGVSSVTVIIVGIALILVCRGYIKWRIPLTFLVTTAIIATGYSWYYGEDITLRVAFHLFIGSAIFLSFFMATDPATTPLTSTGQVIFAIGLSVLSFVFQIYFVFLGGSILALVIMNLTVPLLNRVGINKPFGRR
jgi:electron transport complex protein RnfD